MSLTGLLDFISDHPAYQSLLAGVTSGQMVQSTDAPEAARPYLISALWRHLAAPVLVVVPRPEDARKLHDQILAYVGEDSCIYLFPEPEVLPFERLVADAATNNERMLVLAALARIENGESFEANGDRRHPLVVTSVAAAVRKTLGPEAFKGAIHTLGVGDRAILGELFSRWVDLGYRREEGVEVPGTFSQRGGIVDIYSPSSSLPARVEFWGDEIESIRLFDPVSQRSVRKVERVSIIPANEVLPSLTDRERVSDMISGINLSRCTGVAAERIQDELASLFSGQDVEELPFYNGLLNSGGLIDHLPDDGVMVLVREGEIESEALSLETRAEGLRSAREGRGELPANFPSPQVSSRELSLALDQRRRVCIGGGSGLDGGLDFQPAPAYYDRPDNLAGGISNLLDDATRVVVVSLHARRLSELLEDGGLGGEVTDQVDSLPPQGSLHLLPATLRGGWSLRANGYGLVVLTDAEVFGTAKERRPRPRSRIRREKFLSDLEPGKYVVHIDHGVARFSGSVNMESGGEEREFLVLEYAEGDKLYVPTDHLDRVSPYLAPNDRSPSLTRLGTAEWSRVKERVKNSARELAQELLEIYASRQVATGHAFPPDTPWQRELEDSFPYEETQDQREAIRKVMKDMEMARPMDRLVCGDVGYGKTEVALRASFKVVSDGMQVAVLVPTTVLAQQHYATFSERLSPFPVRVEVLSRFRTKNEQAAVVESLRLGMVDIVIGTHRLLQKDVIFKNLGLVVVDEEQRFGVSHKERLKRMRREVDLLTLSATPIPRTLYMGLSGIRDMSTMETPPEDRQPVRTYVSEYNEDVIKEALLRELERGGQVFFLHNRVQTIRRVADQLKKLVPEARVAVGHGRLAEDELEEVMLAFSRGEVDVLVCTTIIESGLDIPNANTLIIDRSDRFGLSQLYQLRGRVGRGGQRAHSYLLVPRRKRITEAAGKRLKAILEATELGAGYRIAMRDLEIRGAGNVLGAEQSGHVHSVGFELYAQLLNQAVEEIRSGQGEGPPALEPKTCETQIRVSLKLSAQLPDSYISHLPTRLAIYQRLTKVSQREELRDMGDELRDRFGPLPEMVASLLYLVDLKLLAEEAGVVSIVQSGASVTINLPESVGGATTPLEKELGPLVRVGHRQLHFNVKGAGEDWKESLTGVLERFAAFRERLGSIAVPG